MAIVNRNIEVNIVNGPSLDALLDSLKYASDKKVQLSPIFTSEYGRVYSVVVTGLERIDTDAEISLKGKIDLFDADETFARNFTGTYDVKKRTGKINFSHAYATGSIVVSETELANINELAKNFDRDLIQTLPQRLFKIK